MSPEKTPAHTPGPWIVGSSRTDEDGQVLIPVYLATRNAEIATVEGSRIADTVHANARLIAAAPDLLAALETAKHMLGLHVIRSVGTCERCGGNTPNGTLKVCRKCGLEQIDAALTAARTPET